jgi:hypothetical protein
MSDYLSLWAYEGMYQALTSLCLDRRTSVTQELYGTAPAHCCVHTADLKRATTTRSGMSCAPSSYHQLFARGSARTTLRCHFWTR